MKTRACLVVAALLPCSGTFADTAMVRHLGIDDGLSQSTVTSIMQSDEGTLWFSTGDGVTIFDGEDFSYLTRSHENLQRLQSNYISSTFEDAAGAIWITTLGGGITRFDRTADDFRTWRGGSSLSSDETHVVLEHSPGRIWVGTGRGVDIVDPENGSVRPLADFEGGPDIDLPVKAMAQLEDGTVLIGTLGDGIVVTDARGAELSRFGDGRNGLEGDRVNTIFVDSGKRIWIGTENGGLNLYDPDERRFSQPIVIDDREVTALAEDRYGRLWIGTWSHGLYRHDFETGVTDNFRAREGNPFSIPSDTVLSLRAEVTGTMWVGTYDRGAAWFTQDDARFQSRFPGIDETGLAGPMFWTFAEGPENDLWIGSKSGLTRWNRREGTFEPVDLDTDASDVRALLVDGDLLWVAVRKGGLLKRSLPSGEWLPVTVAEGSPDFRGEYIRLLERDGEDALWIGTHDGLYHFDHRTGVTRHYPGAPQTEGALPHPRVRALHTDRRGGFWVGTSGGLSRHDPGTDTFETFDSGGGWLSDNDVRAVYHEGGDIYYAATGGGLTRIDFGSGEARFFTKKDGLSNETLYSVMPGNDDRLWLTSNNGLFAFDPATLEFERFQKKHGLQGSEFNFNSYASLSGGEIVVGGIDGISLFTPRREVVTAYPPVTRMLKSSLFGPERTGADKGAPRRIDADTDVIRFAFSVMHYAAPEENMLRWKLSPLDEDWNEKRGVNHVVTRENIPAGNYSMRYQGVGSDGARSPIRELAFHKPEILYRRWYMLVAYLLLAAAIGILLQRSWTRTLRRRNLELAVAVEEKTADIVRINSELRDRAEELESVQMERNRFYKQMAHQLRTPLSLVKGPLADLPRQGTFTEKGWQLVSIMNGAVDKLNGLTREIQSIAASPGRIGSSRATVDFRSSIDAIVDVYRQAAKENGTAFKVELPDIVSVTIDVTALEMILDNLLSNAVKNTPSGGAIGLAITSSGTDHLRITTGNTGSSLTDEHVRALTGADPASIPDDRGLGIVALTASKAGGTIEVTTDADGNRITVELPAHWTGSPPDEDRAARGAIDDPDRSRVLLIEDNREFREYLTDFLAGEYLVTGVASLRAARRAIDTKNFDLILSDVLVSDGSGLDFVKETKSHPDTSHLPAIVMTALTDEETHREALRVWSDDFLAKPFEPHMLLLKIRTRLRAIRQVRERMLSGLNRAVPDDTAIVVEIAPVDERMIKCLHLFLDENFARNDVRIEDAAKACAVSKRKFQRKLSEMFGRSFSELILERRLLHATQALEKGHSVQQAAAQSGFTHASYFSRRFKELKGMTPTEYRTRAAGSE